MSSTMSTKSSPTTNESASATQSTTVSASDAPRENLPSETVEIQTYSHFEDMELNESLLRGIFGKGFDTPSSIQSQAIMPMIQGHDIIAQAQSGTGKTGTFSIGALSRVDPSIPKPQILVLAPNRELADQIFSVASELGTYMNLNMALIIGGTPVEENLKALDSGVQFIVGTPGRVFDMIKRYVLKTDKIRSFIMDEADEMLSNGFKDQIYEIFQYIPKKAQVCLFSATMPEAALDMTQRFMTNPVKILTKREELTLQGIKQYYQPVPQESWKIATLVDLYEKLSIGQSIIFANSRRKAEFIKEQLLDEEYTAHCIHGDMPQADRNEIMRNFKAGKVRILIATDIIARGIDVQQVSIVINYDMPRFREVYIHRIGRSGRYGRKGTAINFVTEREYQSMMHIQDFYKTDIERLPKNIKELLR